MAQATTTTTKTKYYYAKGRRKTSVATARIFVGKGENMLNDKPLAHYYSSKNDQKLIQAPFALLETEEQFYFHAHTKGGGIMSQRDAIVHALARALVVYKPEFKTVLKKSGLMTRDPRMVERKKTGLKKARKAPQFSKR